MLNAEPPHTVQVPIALIHLFEHFEHLFEGDVALPCRLLVPRLFDVGNGGDIDIVTPHFRGRDCVNQPERVAVQELTVRGVLLEVVWHVHSLQEQIDGIVDSVGIPKRIGRIEVAPKRSVQGRRTLKPN